MVTDRKSLDIDAVANADGLTAVAERLAAECLAPRAAHYDDTATHPVDSWRDVWRQGMLPWAFRAGLVALSWIC